MPLAGHGLRPPALRQRVGRPQLKRGPLGGVEQTTVMDEHLSQIRSIIARYLDDTESFDAAVSAVAKVLRAAGVGGPAAPQPAKPSHISLKGLSVSEWMNPPEPSTPPVTLSPLVLAPGRPAKDEARAREVYIRAFRHALASKGDAA